MTFTALSPELRELVRLTRQPPANVPLHSGRNYLNHFRMSPESHYCFYGSVECLSLGLDVANAAPYMGLNMDGMIDDNAFSPAHATYLYEHWRDTAPPEQLAIIDLMSVLQLADYGKSLVAAAADMCATQAGDTVFRGCVRDYYDRDDLRGSVFGFLREDATGMAERMGLIYERWEQTRQRYTPLEIIHLASMWRMQFENPDEYDVVPFADVAPDMDIMDAPMRQAIHQQREALGKARRAVKKGIRTFQKLFGKDPRLTAFLSGDKITVEGEFFDYVITRTTSVLGHTMGADRRYHVPYSLALYNKQGVYLAEACVYFEATPVIDQLIGLMTYIKHGCEEEVLKTANYFSRAKAFYEEPKLKELGKVMSTPVAVIDTPNFDDPAAAADYRRTQHRNRLRSMGDQVSTERDRVYPEVEAYVRGRIHVPDRIMEIGREHYLAFDELVDHYRAGLLAEDTPLLALL